MSEDLKTTLKITSPDRDGQPQDDAAALVVIRGEPFGKMFQLGHKPISIGRSSSCDIQFGEDSVSRLQCQIWEADQGYWLADSQSTNPTLLNGDAVDRSQLRDGDRIAFGAVVLKFLATASVETAFHSDIYNRAVHDPLTGVPNRRAFDETLSRRVRASARDGSPLSLAIVDIDHFKRINDSYDHLTGDGVLRGLTDLLSRRCPDTGLVARLGGEEFALLLPGKTLAEATQLMEAMRREVSAQPLISEQRSIAVTISIGVAQLRPHTRNPATLFRQADHALLEAKKTGRNRLCSAPSADSSG